MECTFLLTGMKILTEAQPILKSEKINSTTLHVEAVVNLYNFV